MLDLSLKGGALVENTRYKLSINFNQLSPDNTSGSAVIDSNSTQVLPEIKLSLGYQLVENLSLSASWMHVFGSDRHINLDINPAFPPGIFQLQRQNPTIGAFLLGATYTFPA